MSGRVRGGGRRRRSAEIGGKAGVSAEMGSKAGVSAEMASRAGVGGAIAHLDVLGLLESRAARCAHRHVVARREGDGLVRGRCEGDIRGRLCLRLGDRQERDHVRGERAVVRGGEYLVALLEGVDARGRAVGLGDDRRRGEARVAGGRSRRRRVQRRGRARVDLAAQVGMIGRTHTRAQSSDCEARQQCSNHQSLTASPQEILTDRMP